MWGSAPVATRRIDSTRPSFEMMATMMVSMMRTMTNVMAASGVAITVVFAKYMTAWTVDLGR